VFEAAGRRPGDYLRFHRLDPICGVQLEGGPFLKLPASRPACEELVREIAPADAGSFSRLLRTLDEIAPAIDRSIFRRSYDRPWQLADPNLILFAARFDVRATYKELVDRMFSSPLLRAFFYGFPSYSGQSYDSKAPGALLIPYYMLTEGVFYPEGGVGAIPAALARLALELGVEIRTNTRVVGLDCDGSRIQAALLEGGARVNAESFIANVDRSTVRGWLGHVERARPSLSYFTIHFGVRRSVDLEHHNLFIPAAFESGFEGLYRKRVFPEPPIVYVNATSATDSPVAPEGCANLFAVVSTPAEEPTIDWKTNGPHFRERIFSALGRFGLDFSSADMDFERIQDPPYFAREHGNYRGSLYGVDERDRMFGGMFPPANRDLQHPNLYYCGGSVQPGAGLPMVTLSGKFAAQMLPG
jgi:phytoene desaturase